MKDLQMHVYCFYPLFFKSFFFFFFSFFKSRGWVGDSGFPNIVFLQLYNTGIYVVNRTCTVNVPTIDHFTVVCYSRWPSNKMMVGVTLF